MNIIKRNGTEVIFDKKNIINAINAACEAVPDDFMEDDEILEIAKTIESKCEILPHTPSVEEISDMTEEILMNSHKKIAKEFITYRYKRTLARKANTTDDEILSLLERNNELVKQENSNKDPIINSTQRDYMAGEVSKDLTERMLLPDDIVKAHKEGLIHFHDADYFAQHMHNCGLVNLEDMLQNGTVISDTMIETPKTFATACNIATQAIAQIASSQYGGQSITLTHLAPFVNKSRMKYRMDVREELESIGIEADDEKVNKIAEKRTREEINRGVQIIQYQVITLMTTNGQAPFVTVNMYLNETDDPQTKTDLALIIEEVLNQRIQGVKNEDGIWVTPAFPKLIYVLEEDNIYEDSKYWYLTELAAKCTAKRMVPDYVSEKTMKEMKIGKSGKGQCYPPMGCRSFLTPDRITENIANARNYDAEKEKFYGRFNQGVVTINLVDVACSSNRDKEKFWKILDERLEICHRALRCRHERLLGTPSDVSPILWQHGAYARLKKGETIDKLLFNGYSTISLGYAGLYEMCRYMLGVSHTDVEGTSFAMQVMQRLNDKCKEWKTAENIDYSVYGTPLESTTYKFAKCLQNRFGKIKDVTDHNYITNSYHVNVREQINAFEKLAFEAPFQKLSPGGAISYVEVPNLTDNIPAVLAVIQYIYDNIMYAELNSKSDYCMECGYDGEIQIVEDHNHKLVWECPNCGNREQNKIFVARRTCGYIGTQFWNQGRTQEIKDRVIHLGYF